MGNRDLRRDRSFVQSRKLGRTFRSEVEGVGGFAKSGWDWFQGLEGMGRRGQNRDEGAGEEDCWALGGSLE